MRSMTFSSGCRYLLIACWLLVLVLSSDAGEQQAAGPFDKSAFQASPAEIQAAAAKIPAEKDTDATVLYEEAHYALDTAGRVTEQHRLVYRIETATGLESWSEAAVQWEAFYQQEPRIRARVIGKDGHVVELDAATLTDVPAKNDSNGDYSDERVHKGPLPALAVGAVIEEETELIDKEPFFNGGGAYRAYLQRYVPVEHSRVVVEAPLDVPLQYETSNLPGLAVRKEETGGIRRITFDQGHLDAMVRSDIDLATSKPRLPLVQFSTGASWKSVADAYRQLAEPQIQPEQVRSLLPGTKSADRMSTVESLVVRLHKDVRYTGIEFGEARLQPRTPQEVLKRHYGDCKDKAALLVAMLRASGIPANLALLNAGPGMDISPQLPGMNQFDHAIVFVPAAANGGTDLWIDATAKFSPIGTLPYADRGRQALIIAEGTTALTLTPQAKPEDDQLVETREFHLAEQGPAEVIETSEAHGDIDATYRSSYGGTESKAMKDDLESYAKSAYLAKALTAIDHGDGSDLTKPFKLQLKIGDARRGYVGINDGAVLIFPSGLLNRLPRWFFVDPKPTDQKTSDAELAEQQKAESQRSTEYDVQPIIAQWQYKISVPVGFAPRTLPPNKTTQMGPATLTQEYSSDHPGLVTATLKFNSGKEHYNTDEVLALRKAVLELNKEDGVIVGFDQDGSKLIAEGKTREALAANRALMGQHPKEAIHHVQMAYTLLAAGVGDQARVEALKATELEPKSAIAFSALGWMLQFNSIGVHFGSGFDLQGAKAAYRKAQQLDPRDTDHRANLAILNEYDEQGIRYSPSADLNGAVAEYRQLKQQDAAVANRYEDNLLYALLYARRFDDLLSEAAPLPGSAEHFALIVAATTAQHGGPAGLQRADQLTGNTDVRNNVLRISGVELLRLGLYSEAADILSEGLQGDQGSASGRQVEMLRSLKAPEKIPETDPRFPVQKLMAVDLSGKLDDRDINQLLTRHAYGSDAEWNSNLKKNRDSAGALQLVSARTNLPPSVLRDITLGTMKLTAQGHDATGYIVTSQTVGSVARHYFVVKEDGRFKIVATNKDFAEIGNEALYLLQQDNEDAARKLLDWKREDLHKGGGDDPLAGPLMPRFWTSGESKGRDSIRLTAASLLIGNESMKGLLPEIAARRQHPATDKGELVNLDLLLAYAYLQIGDGARAKVSSQQLLLAYPDSIVAMRLAGGADRLTGDFAAWKAMLASRLMKHPNSRELLLLEADEAESEGDFLSASKDLHTVIEGGEAVTGDYNLYAWLALFTGKVGSDAIEASHQANELSKNTSFNELHTLGSLYAAQGKTAEARQVILEGMSTANMAEPNSAAWYVFGSIYEQYGIRDAAIAAYGKVEKPEGTVNPVDTWVLAQQRLKALQAK